MSGRATPRWGREGCVRGVAAPTQASVVGVPRYVEEETGAGGVTSELGGVKTSPPPPSLRCEGKLPLEKHSLDGDVDAGPFAYFLERFRDAVGFSSSARST